MNQLIRIVCLVLLLFNSAGALFGGLQLMADPTGSSLGMTTALLDPSPFRDYFIPGMILFVIHGIMSLATAVLLLLRWPPSGFFLAFQGMAMIIWIMVQFFLLNASSPWQVILGSIGLILLLCGLQIHRSIRQSASPR